MKKRLQFRLLREIKNRNWSEVYPLIKREDVYLSSLNTEHEKTVHINDYMEPVYFFLAYSLTDENLNKNSEIINDIFDIFIKQYNDKISYLKAPFFEKKEDYYTPAYYLEKIYKRNIKNNTEESKELFKKYVSHFIDKSSLVNKEHVQADCLAADNRNQLSIPLYLDYYKKNNILPPVDFVRELFPHNMYQRTRSDSMNKEYFIQKEELENSFPLFFSKEHVEKRVIPRISLFYTSGEFALWIYKKNQIAEVIQKEEQGKKYINSLLPAIVVDFCAGYIQEEKPVLSQLIKINETKNDLYQTYPYSFYREESFVTLRHFIFNTLPYTHNTKSDYYEQIVSMIADNIDNHFFNDTLNPMEFLLQNNTRLENENCNNIIHIFSQYPVLYARNNENGRNFWHSVRSSKNIEQLDIFLNKSDINNIDNNNNHAFSEITYHALINKDNELINWLANIITRYKDIKFSGSYNKIPLLEMIKNNSTLYQAFNKGKETNIAPEINLSCFHLKIQEINQMIKNPNVDYNQINSKGETPLLLLLKSDKNTSHAFSKKNKIYDLLKKGINHDLIISYKKEKLTAIDVYAKTYQREWFHPDKERFFCTILRKTNSINHEIIGRYIADVYLFIANQHQYSPKIQKETIEAFNRNIGINRLTIELQKSIVNNLVNFEFSQCKDKKYQARNYLLFKEPMLTFPEVYENMDIHELSIIKNKLISNKEALYPKINSLSGKEEFLNDNTEILTLIDRQILFRQLDKPEADTILQSKSKQRI